MPARKPRRSAQTSTTCSGTRDDALGDALRTRARISKARREMVRAPPRAGDVGPGLPRPDARAYEVAQVRVRAPRVVHVRREARGDARWYFRVGEAGRLRARYRRRIRRRLRARREDARRRGGGGAARHAATKRLGLRTRTPAPLSSTQWWTKFEAVNSSQCARGTRCARSPNSRVARVSCSTRLPKAKEVD